MARDFPGTSGNRLQIGSDVAALDITGTALTVAAWIRPDSISLAQQRVVSKAPDGAATDPYLLRLDLALLNFHIRDAGGYDSVNGAVSQTASVWVHAAGVKNGTGAGALKVYSNGVQDGSATSNKSIQDGAGDVELGRVFTSSDVEMFDGRIAEVAIWNVALSADEILALAKGTPAGMIRRNSLAGYWPLQALTSPEIDDSDNNNNFTIVGSVPAADHAPVGLPVLF